MDRVPTIARRLERLPVRTVLGCEVPVARTAISRLLGLAWLKRDRAGTGLLIPGCRSVHTFGMRFEIEVVFLDRSGRIVRWERRVSAARRGKMTERSFMIIKVLRRCVQI